MPPENGERQLLSGFRPAGLSLWKQNRRRYRRVKKKVTGASTLWPEMTQTREKPATSRIRTTQLLQIAAACGNYRAWDDRFGRWRGEVAPPENERPGSWEGAITPI